MFIHLLGEAYPIIREVAPTLATALASPLAGAATSWAISLLGNAFGVDPENIDKLGATIATSEDAKTKLANVEKLFMNAPLDKQDFLKNLASAEINIKVTFNNQGTMPEPMMGNE